MSNLMTRQQISVQAEGTLVAFQVGNNVMRMGYEDSLVLAQWLRVAGKEAKRTAGDFSRTWHAIAQLGDAEMNDKAHQRREF